MITVFTPTYNRAYILPKLYESLCSQTSKDFEWLIVDDGSTDDTESLVQSWLEQKCLAITYKKIENGGKSNAINIGVELAKGDLFFIVDSDDFLAPDAIEIISENEKILHSRDIPFLLAGHCYQKCNYNTGDILTSSNVTVPEFASSLELAFTYGQTGDKAEVFYTDVLKRFPFPSISNCKFIPEALIWYRIADAGYKFLIKDAPIYMCEYIADGYTKNFKANLRKNCKGFALFYQECLHYKDVPLFVKMKYCIRFLQCKWYGVMAK